MSRDCSSSRKPSQSRENENEFVEFESSSNPIHSSRAPLISIPDPSQIQSNTPPPPHHHHHHAKGKPQLMSSLLRTPSSSVYSSRGKSPFSGSNSASIGSNHPCFSNVGGAVSGSVMRFPFQLSSGGGKLGVLPRVSGGVSLAVPRQLLADVPCFELDEDPSFWKDHNVQVMIRIRPLDSTELASQGYGRCLRQESSQTVVWLGNPETRFTFDHIACESTSQEKLFGVAGLPMVDNCMSGYNSCMFAYGQTGSGKTYTMMGEFDNMDGKLREDCGITPRIFEYLFARITKEEESRKHEKLTYSCKCSFLEIYNEHITDLLEPSSTNLQLREDLKKGVYVENLSEHSVSTVNDVLKLLQQGAANRKIAATYMNSESSRSHSVFTCIIESRWEKDSMSHLRFGRLNLVDLAGSERQKSSGAEGDRLKEAANINKSLSTLGLVIMSLVDLAQGKHRHVPYRDSRLTFLLQDSLGGNSKTTIIANVSPSTRSANETLSTLKFAQRAKLIQNNAKINEDASGDVIVLQQQIQQLKGQLSFLMKHQHDSIKLLDVPPSPNQSSSGYYSARCEPSEEINAYDEHKTYKGGNLKTNFNAILRGALRREKLAETEIRKLKAEIEHLNRLSHQREKEAQRSKMMLRLREEKIKRLESLSDRLISADKFYLGENNALREENLLLQEKIDRNPEVIRFASENIRLLEQIRLYQYFNEQGEREKLLAEISELRNQILELLEVENSYACQQFTSMKGKQESEVGKELEQCRDMNSKLIREVDELRHKLSNGMNFDQETSNSIENGLLKNDSVDDATSNNLSGVEITNDRNNQQINNILELQFDNVHKQLIDAQTSIATLEAKQFQLINKLESVQAENQHLMKMLDGKGIPQSEVKHKHEEYYRKQDGSRNQDPAVAIEVSEGTSITALQATLDKLSCDLKEARMLNRQYINDQATRLSQDHQTESVRNEVEMETTKTIMYLQEEIDKLQSEYEVRLCSLAEQNLSLRNSMAIKEDKLKMLHAEWERGTLELSTFLIDGCRSLGDASCQIKSICSSFPNVNDWVNEHVEKAVKICLEKEETILLLQRSLEDAQKTVMQMEQQLHSLKGATVALTELQQLEKSSCREEIQLCRMSNGSIEVKESTENFGTSPKDQISENKNNPALMVANSVSNDSTGTLRSILKGNQSLVHTNAYAPGEVDIQIELAMLILTEIEGAVSGSCSDAVEYWAALKSDIHDTVSMYKELVQDLLKDVSDMRKEINVLKSNQGSIQFSNDIIPSCTPLKHESQFQVPERIRNELVEVKKRLSSLGACFYSFMNMHCRQDTNVGCTGADEWTSDCSSSCSNSSAESIDTDEKSSTDVYKCTSRIAEQKLDLNCDEGSMLDLFVKEFRKAYDVIVNLTDQLMEFCIGVTNHSCVPDILFSDPCTLQNIKEQGKDAHDQSTSQKFEAGSKIFWELVEKQIQPVSFFKKYEEAYETIKEADSTLKAMLKANENATILTTMWKQAGEKLMADKASMSEEIKQLKSSILSRNGEKEVLQDQQEISNMLSLLEDCFLQMQTNVEKLFETARRDAIEETQAYVCSLRSTMEDSLCKAMQNDIIMFVLQGQMVEYFHKLRRLNTTSKSDRSATREHCLPTGGLELGPASGDNNSAFHAVECETEGDHIENEFLEIEKLDLVEDNTVNENFALQKELERKETLLKGLLFDFSLLQELASHRKDTKDELQKLVIALSKVQYELQNKTVQLDDVLVQNTKLEGRLAEAVQDLFSSNSELVQAKRKLNILLEQNAELKGLLKDLYLKNSEAEDLIEEKKELIRCLEKEIIHVSSLPEKQLIRSAEDIEDTLKRVTAERDEFVEKIIFLQDKLDMACALADENQAMAVEARQESEASKMYAEQKEEEVKILEHSIEELECTINVLEKKMDEMEEEVEKHQLMRDSLELELQSLRHRLLTVEDLTESMASENSNTAVPEEQVCRKLDTKSAENNEAHGQIRFLEDENARQSKEIKLFKNYVSELILHAEAQASQYQQKYKTLESMLHEVKMDLSNVSALPTSERGEKNSTRTRGSSSPFRCIAGLVQQMNQEKDQELSMARLRIEELEAVAASRHKEVCILNTRLATAESMTHDVIRDLLSVKLDISNYANIIDQHQLQKLIEEAQYQREEFAAMEQENVNLRSQIDDLLDERERCISEINQYRADQIDTQILLEQVQERDQMLIAQNDMLKMDKSNLQKRVVELDDMVKKLFKMQDPQSRNQPGTSSVLRPLESDLSERLVHSQKTLSRINNQLAQYRRSDGNKLEVRGKEMKLRKQ